MSIRHTKEKGELLAQMQQIRDEKSKMMDTTRQEYEKELEQLHQDINDNFCLLYTSPSPRDGLLSRKPSSA